jgi:hypothetical protein
MTLLLPSAHLQRRGTNNLQPPPSTGSRDLLARPQALSVPPHLRLNEIESAQSRPQVRAQSRRHRPAPVVSTHLRSAESSWSSSLGGRRPRLTRGTSDLSPDFQALTFCTFHRNAGQASIAALGFRNAHRGRIDLAPIKHTVQKRSLACRELKQRRQLFPALRCDALDPGCGAAKDRPFGREKRTEQARNYPFQRIF